MRRNNASRGRHGGPLMTEHLQLQDLDLELELLKRKREMIEQQQQMLSSNQSFNRPRPFDYGNTQPRPLFPEQHQPFSNSSSFSRFYDEPQQSQSFGGGGLLGKRHNDSPVWQAHSAPKRFSGPQGGPKKKFGAGPSPKSHNQNSRQQNSNSGSFSQFKKPGSRQQWDKPKPSGAPKSTFPSQRFNSTPKGSKPQQRDFRPNKVTKSKPPQQGNKLASYPTPERKKFAQQAAKSSKDEDDFTGDQYILRADSVPSQQMAGRLELALGNILKEIKTKYGNAEPHIVSFQSQFLNRKMKQAIRERLRGVMLGKPVGKVGAIVEHYRKVFPADTDSEILDVALAEQQNHNKKHLAIKLESADSAFKYLKVNMNKLIGVTLDDMFEKVQKIYEDIGDGKAKEICENIISEAIDLAKDEETGEGDKNDSVKEVNAEGHEIEVKESKIEGENGEAEESTEKASENIEEKPSGDSDDKPSGDEVAVSDDKPSNDESTGEAITTGDDKPSNDESTGEAIATGDDKPAVNKTPIDEKSSEENKPSENDEKPTKKFQKPEWKKIDELIVNLIKRRLPYILPKFKPQLMKVLNAVGSYQVTKTAILDKTQNRLDLENRIEQAEQSLNNTVDLSKNDETPTASTPKHNQSGRFSYMIKILGRPVLPKRKIMQSFLDQYKPTSVKKHRNMHLLFVAFDNKDAFDKIVAVKETSLGNCTISIKVSEKSAAKPNESLNATQNADALNDSTDKIIGADLDDQINDLLLSIRKEEESTLIETEGDDVEMVPTPDKPEAVNETVPNENGSEVAANGTNTANENEEANRTEEKADENKDTGNDASEEKPDEVEDKVENEEAKDKVEALKADAKESGRVTPTRTSSRLATTPSSVRTRRASRLAQN